MNLNMSIPCCSTGYGVAALNIAKALDQLRHEIAIFPIGGVQVETQEDAIFLQKCIDRQGLFDYNAPSLRIFHQNNLAVRIGRGEAIGFPIFELDRFSEVEKNHLLSLDKIFVCSEWAKQIVKEQIGKDAYVIPLGINPDIFYPQWHKSWDNFHFFNCGKTEVRKGHDILLELFERAFPNTDDCYLDISWDNPFLKQHEKDEWENYYKNSKVGDRITFHPRVSTQRELSDLMAGISCGIFPSRAEGFGLEGLEVMSMGAPIITTNYAGHTSYCTHKNSFLIEAPRLEVAEDGIWFRGEGKWASIQETEKLRFIYHMRNVYDRWKAGEDITNHGGVETGHRMTWDNTAKKIMEAINYV